MPGSAFSPPQAAARDAADLQYMGEALALARLAMEGGEVPIGAVVVSSEGIIGAAHNAPIRLHDPTGHAEILALRAAGKALSNYRFPGTCVYVTVEPCLMCVGALMQARVDRVVFGCPEPKTGALGSVVSLAGGPGPRFQVQGRVREEECRALLQEFFRRRRSV